MSLPQTGRSFHAHCQLDEQSWLFDIAVSADLCGVSALKEVRHLDGIIVHSLHDEGLLFILSSSAYMHAKSLLLLIK